MAGGVSGTGRRVGGLLAMGERLVGWRLMGVGSRYPLYESVMMLLYMPYQSTLMYESSLLYLRSHPVVSKVPYLLYF